MTTISIVKDGEDLEHVPSPAYLVGSNGIHLHVSNQLFDAVVPVKDAPGLQELQTKITLKLPPVPWELIERSVGFFRKVHEDMNSEAVVLLLWDGAWSIETPEQTTAGMHVDYEMNPGKTYFGSIHSHCDVSAFSSGTDKGDEKGFPGIHITVGDLTKPFPSFHARVSVAGEEIEVEPDQVIEFPKGVEPDLDMMKQVKSPPPLNQQGPVREFFNRIWEREDVFWL